MEWGKALMDETSDVMMRLKSNILNLICFIDCKLAITILFATDRGQASTIEKIFCLLNYEDLKKFGQVSLEWKDLVKSHDNYWKKILDKKVIT